MAWMTASQGSANGEGHTQPQPVPAGPVQASNETPWSETPCPVPTPTEPQDNSGPLSNSANTGQRKRESHKLLPPAAAVSAQAEVLAKEAKEAAAAKLASQRAAGSLHDGRDLAQDGATSPDERPERVNKG